MICFSYITVDRRNHCRAAIAAFAKHNPEFDSDWVYYDLQSILFSIKAIDLDNKVNFRLLNL